MKNKKETISFVLIGYTEKINNFYGRLLFSDAFKNFKFSEKDQFTFTSNNITSDDILEQFRNQFPVRIFESDNKEIVIKYVIPENKIIIENNNFVDAEFDNFEQLCLNVIDETKIKQAKALGLNFSIIYDLNYKLRLFNNQIDKLTMWENNTGFSISIPLGIDDIITANYKIEKLSEVGEGEQKIRTYKTFVNYNFKLDNNNFDLKKIFLNGKTNLYKLFKNNQEVIESIGQSKNDR